MKYKDYIDLGFKREERNDNVLFERIGYTGYYLSKRVNRRMKVTVDGEDLNSPVLHIQIDRYKDMQHWISITPEQVKDIFYKE